MIVTTLGGLVAAIVRVFEGEKWCKVIVEDTETKWVRTADLAEEVL